LLRGHGRVAIDSNVLIYLLEQPGRLADRAGSVLDAIAAGEAEGIMATLTLTEVCAGPARAGDPAMVERYADELTSLENVRLIPLTSEVAVDAAATRGTGPLGLADAIHLASARSAGATAFVTNDRRISSTPALEVLYLDEL
jgi:predicted nucleic acid-binding protein